MVTATQNDLFPCGRVPSCAIVCQHRNATRLAIPRRIVLVLSERSERSSSSKPALWNSTIAANRRAPRPSPLQRHESRLASGMPGGPRAPRPGGRGARDRASQGPPDPAHPHSFSSSIPPGILFEDVDEDEDDDALHIPNRHGSAERRSPPLAPYRFRTAIKSKLFMNLIDFDILRFSIRQSAVPGRARLRRAACLQRRFRADQGAHGAT